MRIARLCAREVGRGCDLLTRGLGCIRLTVGKTVAETPMLRLLVTVEVAEQMGRDAALRGATLQDNPFKPGSECACSWALGVMWVSHHEAHTW